MLALFPFGCCTPSEPGESYWRGHQERKLRLLTHWRDGLERQLAGLNAAINKLEEQMRRPAPGPGASGSASGWVETRDAPQ
jgi:hypothetical protein